MDKVSIRIVDTHPQLIEILNRKMGMFRGLTIQDGSTFKQRVDVIGLPVGHTGEVKLAYMRALWTHSDKRLVELIQAVARESTEVPLGLSMVYKGLEEGSPSSLIVPGVAIKESISVNEKAKTIAMACVSMFQSLYQVDDEMGGDLQTAALPGIGLGLAQIPPVTIATFLSIAHRIYRDGRITDVDEILDRLNFELSNENLTQVAQAGLQPGEATVLYEAIDKHVERAEGGDESGAHPEPPAEETYVESMGIGTPLF